MAIDVKPQPLDVFTRGEQVIALLEGVHMNQGELSAQSPVAPPYLRGGFMEVRVLAYVTQQG